MSGMTTYIDDSAQQQGFSDNWLGAKAGFFVYKIRFLSIATKISHPTISEEAAGADERVSENPWCGAVMTLPSA